MLKLSLAELEQAIKLIRRTSNDYHALISFEPGYARITYSSADNEVCTISIYDEDSKVQAKLSTAVSLASEVARRKL